MTLANDMLEVFHGKLITALDQIVPEKLIPDSTNQVINIAWMTSGIIKSSKKQLYLYKKSLHGTAVDIVRYKEYRDCLKRIK